MSHHSFESLVTSSEKIGKMIGGMKKQSPADRLGGSVKGVHYIRYMDDMVITGHDRKAVYGLAMGIRSMVAETLKLSIPYHKTVHLRSDPVPFLGYVIDHCGARPLGRNLRRHRRQMVKMRKAGVRESTLAKAEVSFSAWKTMGKKQLYAAPKNG